MKLSYVLPILGALTLPLAANAFTLTESASAPTGSTISQPLFDGAITNSKDRTDVQGTPSQTFTVGATGFSLASITVKGGGSSGGFAAGGSYFVLSIRTETGVSSGTSTRILQDVSQAFTPASNNSTSYLTFALSTPLTLNANGIYAFDIYTTDSTDYSTQGTGSSYYAFAKSSTDSLAGGTAFQNGYQAQNQRFSVNPGRFDTVQTVDRTFFLNAAVAVPEPSSIAFGIAVSVLAFYAIYRRLFSVA